MYVGVYISKEGTYVIFE